MPIYMKIEDINGNVTAKGYEKWIEISSFSFSVNRNINTKPGSVYDRESTRPSLSEIEITKIIDKSSPYLFTESCIGKVKSIKIDVCQSGENISPYVQYVLSNVIISGYSVNFMSNQNERLVPVEHVKLNFGKIEMKFTSRDEKNNPESPITSGYNLMSAEKI